MASRRSPTKLEQYEAVWAFIARILAFFMGAGILSYETLVDHGRSGTLILAGIGLMGPQFAALADALLRRLPSEKR